MTSRDSGHGLPRDNPQALSDLPTRRPVSVAIAYWMAFPAHSRPEIPDSRFANDLYRARMTELQIDVDTMRLGPLPAILTD